MIIGREERLKNKIKKSKDISYLDDIINTANMYDKISRNNPEEYKRLIDIWKNDIAIDRAKIIKTTWGYLDSDKMIKIDEWILIKGYHKSMRIAEGQLRRAELFLKFRNIAKDRRKEIAKGLK